MNRVLVVVAILLGCAVLPACATQPSESIQSSVSQGSSGQAVSDKPLPPHEVARDGQISLVGEPMRRRIEIHVSDPGLSKDDCIRLIAAYRQRAGEGGQVSVRKPAPDGSMLPWGVDNMDGRGVTFNDASFAP
jgi:hypothetical protein